MGALSVAVQAASRADHERCEDRTGSCTPVRAEHVALRKKLTGNSLGIVIEKPSLELLDIDRETELELRSDGERLVIEPIRSARRAKVTAAVQRAMAAHDAALRKLAK